MTKLLLVEDVELVRDLLSRRLQGKGYAVICAVDGQEAIELAAAESPELILMDMTLPVLDGWEATRRIKASTPDVLIIALTAHAMEDDERRVREAGCDDYDTKPKSWSGCSERFRPSSQNDVNLSLGLMQMKRCSAQGCLCRRHNWTCQLH